LKGNRDAVPIPRKRSIIIRHATRDDTDFILSLVPRFVAFELPKGRRKRDCIATIHTDIDNALRNVPPSERFFISENAQGERTGFLRVQVQRDFFTESRNCHVSDLAVAPSHDGHGIGGALLDHACAWAKANRCKRLTLSVFPGNARARALYERHGFTLDLLRMTRPLA
jgi:ribosomal protein S18 acetylase RimI-like enzyme